jgi:Mce-associated membrane protein
VTEPAPPRAAGTILGRRAAGELVDAGATVDAGTVEASFAELAESPVEVDAPAPDDGHSAELRRAAPRSGDLGSRWWLVGCVVFALAALVFAVLGLQQRSKLQADQDQTSQIRDVSGRTIAALSSYDYQHLDQWKKSVLADATGSFQNQFQAGFSGFEQTYVAEHNRGTGSIQGVWVGTADAGKASAVVLVQITVTSLTGTHSLEPYVQVTLLKVAGRWRVDDVQATFDTSGGAGTGTTPAPAGGTTPTPAP